MQMISSAAKISRIMTPKHKLVEDIVSGKNVVHYGCVDDNEELIALKHSKGFYLHQIVTDKSNSTLGVDINKKGIKFLAKELNIKNVVYGNVEDPGTFEAPKKKLMKADIVLIPDLIEHLHNPGGMVEGIKKNYSKDIKLAITTPNPFAWYNFIATLLNLEIYSPYHTMHFSMKNIEILLDQCGFKVDKITPTYIPKQRNFLVRWLDGLVGKIAVIISPGFADSFMYECSVKNK